jgi:hypothetical protein
MRDKRADCFGDWLYHWLVFPDCDKVPVVLRTGGNEVMVVRTALASRGKKE